MVYLLFVSLISIFVKTNADLYASTAELEHLVTTRQQVMHDLRLYINEEEKKLSILKRYYNLYKKENEKAMKNITRYIGNPINAFIMVKSLTTDLNNIEYWIKAGIEQKVTLKNKGLVYPTLIDLKGTAQGLSRLIKLYNFNVKDLADGKLDGEVLSSPLSASDCYSLGRALFKIKDFAMAIKWMKEAYRKLNGDDFPYRFTDINILEYISYGYYKLGDISTGLHWTQKILNLEPDHLKAKQSMSGYLKRITKGITKPNMKNSTEETENQYMDKDEYIESVTQQNYEELCRGDVDLSIQILSRLTCRYVTETHPFLKIAPIKMEMKYLDPEVVLFHEFLNDREINIMKRVAIPGLERSKITKKKDAIVHESRVSKATWFYDSQFDVLQRISNRVSHITGLNLKFKHSKHMQICNYGVGGHFMPHVDPQIVHNTTYTYEGGRRLATVMLYMSDVPRGGATVFPRLGVRISPVKGAAAVWYNLHPSGEVNQATLHAACPVLIGSKWVCTKWIHQAGQEIHKPCNLQFQQEGYDVTAVSPPVLTISRDRRLIEEYKKTATKSLKQRNNQQMDIEANDTHSEIQSDIDTNTSY